MIPYTLHFYIHNILQVNMVLTLSEQYYIDSVLAATSIGTTARYMNFV